MPNIEQGTFFSVQLNAQRVLRRKLAMITDAISPGGIGDAFWQALTAQEREALVARMVGHTQPDITLYAGKGFQDVNLPEHRFDLAISNVPFGDVGVADHFKKRLMRCYRYSLTAKS